MNTEMEEVVSILQNPEKIKQLILKLKTIGTNSPQFQNFKNCLDSFCLSKSPKGVHEKNILQTTFKFCDPRECFSSFRMVCKSWQNAVETIRLDTSPEPVVELLQELCDQERNGNFPAFYAKYFQIFRRLILYFPLNFDMTKWNSIAKLLTTNVKNLKFLGINRQNFPKNLTVFVFNLFQNSQCQLESITLCANDLIYLPNIPLPKLINFSIWLTTSNNDQIGTFDYIMKTFVDSGTMCTNLKKFKILSLNKAPKILKYIIQNYPQHFIFAPSIDTLEHIPLIASVLKLENLAPYRFISQIEYLNLHVENFSTPSAGGWDNYKEITNFCPNLKGICFHDKKHIYIQENFPQSLSSTNQNIWQQRISYFNSHKIKFLPYAEYRKIMSDLIESKPSWYFEFRF